MSASGDFRSSPSPPCPFVAVDTLRRDGEPGRDLDDDGVTGGSGVWDTPLDGPRAEEDESRNNPARNEAAATTKQVPPTRLTILTYS